MKRVLALALLLVSFTLAALADGSGGAPPPAAQVIKSAPLADGSGGAPPPAMGAINIANMGA
jgi:hypothetical protein